MAQQTFSQDVLLLDGDTASRVAELFSALGDPTRVRIIAALMRGEVNVSDLAAAVAMSTSAVSHQLRNLRQMRLVRALCRRALLLGLLHHPDDAADRVVGDKAGHFDFH
ncbi:MAG: metalloregulator ArsR/SmtB family transcription factor, partial [Chloroflexi bacterium]|nr:metalloregulator ArsR/SmtB family transcription factor [Chloroflexota bacterium]